MGRKKKIVTTTPQLLKGFKDIFGVEQKYLDFLIQKLEKLALAYNFEKITLPILESSSLFRRSVGLQTDIVEKEMFSFLSKDGEEVCLRPEATASVARAYLEHGFISREQPVKLYYYGPMFRYAKPQLGRYRQFHQFGLEILGSASPIVDAEVILFSCTAFKELGLETSLQINSIGCSDCREKYKKKLIDFYKPKRRLLCENCKKRLTKNPLRLLDCKEESCKKMASQSPQVIDYLCESCKTHFIKVLENLDEIGVNYTLNPRVVRGLDYYTRTTFEIWSKDEMELGGGGRYDDLIEMLGGRDVPACGVAFGLERIILKMKEKGITIPEKKKYDIFLAQLGEPARRKCLKIFEELRKEGIKVVHNLTKESLKPQLEIANKLNVKYALILGQKEILDGTIIIRDMESGVQEVVSQQKIVQEIKKRLK